MDTSEMEWIFMIFLFVGCCHSLEHGVSFNAVCGRNKQLNLPIVSNQSVRSKSHCGRYAWYENAQVAFTWDPMSGTCYLHGHDVSHIGSYDCAGAINNNLTFYSMTGPPYGQGVNCRAFDGQPSGVQTITLPSSGTLRVYCDMETAGGGWIVFQRRVDGTQAFDLTWNEYEQGFGDLTKNFWLGNRFLHELTVTGSYQLRFDLEDYANNTRYAQYENFNIGDAASGYTLNFGAFTGNVAVDGLSYHHQGAAFKTKEQGGCSAQYGNQGWWFNNCYNVALNGIYDAADDTGVNWNDYIISPSNIRRMKFTEIKFRPV